MTEPTPVELLSSLTILYEPTRWTESISENVSIDSGFVHRRIQISYYLPDAGLSTVAPLAPQNRTSSNEVRSYFLPLLREPRKGALVDITNLHRTDGGRCEALSHDGHLNATREMLQVRLDATLVPFLENTASDEAEYEQLMADLSSVVAAPAAKAKQTLRVAFQEPDHHCRLPKGGTRPPDEKRLHQLCKMLAEKYPLLVRVESSPGDRVTLEYSVREPYSAESDGVPSIIRRQFGNVPSGIQIPIPLARRTKNYHIRLQAPTGLYFRDFILTDNADTPVETSNIYDRHPERPVAFSASAAGSGPAVAHIHDGAEAQKSLQLRITMYEEPPGATLFAWVIAAISLVLCVGVGIVVAEREVQPGSDLPALIVAIAAGVPVVAGPFLPRSAMFDSPLMARAGLFLTSLSTALFSVWILLFSIPGSGHPNASFLGPDRVVRWFRDWGGWSLTVFIAIVLAFLTFRIRNSMSEYRATVDPTGSEPSFSSRIRRGSMSPS